MDEQQSPPPKGRRERRPSFASRYSPYANSSPPRDQTLLKENQRSSNTSPRSFVPHGGPRSDHSLSEENRQSSNFSSPHFVPSSSISPRDLSSAQLSSKENQPPSNFSPSASVPQSNVNNDAAAHYSSLNLSNVSSQETHLVRREKEDSTIT